MRRVDRSLVKFGFTALTERDGILRRADGVAVDGAPIYLLLAPGGRPVFHRWAGARTFRHLAGDAAELTRLDDGGNVTRLLIGDGPGRRPHVAIAPGVWHAWRIARGGSSALIGATGVGGAEVARRMELTQLFPRHRALIFKFTK